MSKIKSRRMMTVERTYASGNGLTVLQHDSGAVTLSFEVEAVTSDEVFTRDTLNDPSPLTSAAINQFMDTMEDAAIASILRRNRTLRAID